MEKLKLKILYCLMLFLSLIMISCEESMITDNNPEQLFRPVEITPTVSGVTVSFTWTPIKSASYSLQLSQDSLLFTNNLQTYPVDSMHYTYTVDDLLSSTRYSARVKAVSNDPLVEDSGWQEITFNTGIENLFLSVLTADIGVNSVKLNWTAGKSVTQITATAAGLPDIISTISASESSLGQKLITGLSANTSYVFQIYNGTILRGTILVTTITS